MTHGLVHILWRKLRVKWDAYRIRRSEVWEQRHVIRHPDGNVSVHGVSGRAVIRWYGKQNWPSEWRFDRD